MSKTYKGRRATDGETAVVVTEQVDGGQHSYNLAHRTKHSPDGFEWGYSGSAPADLARCILLDYFGEGGEAAAEADYMAFKDEVIACLDRGSGFELTSAEITKWLQPRVVHKALMTVASPPGPNVLTPAEAHLLVDQSGRIEPSEDYENLIERLREWADTEEPR